MIESVQFKNFRVLRDATLPLGRFTLIVGPNGSGKSTALQGLNILNNPGHGHQESATVSVKRVEGSPVVISAVWGEGSAGKETVVEWGPGAGPSLRGERMSGIGIFSLNSDAIASPVQLSPRIELRPDGGHLAGVLDRLRDSEPERFESLNAEMARWLPEFDRILFDTPDGGQRAFLLRNREGHHAIPAQALSQGTLLALAILTLAYVPGPPSMVCLEEPDRGIHPRLLRDIQDALYRLCYPENYGEERESVQVIATTHSPYFLDLYRDHPEEVVIAHKAGLEATFEQLTDQPNVQEILADSHLGDAWYTGILGGVPCQS